MAMIKTITNNPAAETAAAVNAPLMAAATVRDARTSVITSIKTAPKGVSMILVIPPKVLIKSPLYLSKLQLQLIIYNSFVKL